MSVAYYLQLRGHQCDVFEAEPEQGGMLRYGIPQYRLPKGWMDRELNHVWELGATLKPNMRLGRDFHIGDIIDDYDAIYVGIGCYKPNELGIPGEFADGTGSDNSSNDLDQALVTVHETCGNRLSVVRWVSGEDSSDQPRPQ